MTTTVTQTNATQTIGDKIASEFSADKRHLTDAEQRRLAGMIDAATKSANANLLSACRDALSFLDYAWMTYGSECRDDERERREMTRAKLMLAINGLQ